MNTPAEVSQPTADALRASLLATSGGITPEMLTEQGLQARKGVEVGLQVAFARYGKAQMLFTGRIATAEDIKAALLKDHPELAYLKHAARTVDCANADSEKLEGRFQTLTGKAPAQVYDSISNADRGMSR